MCGRPAERQPRVTESAHGECRWRTEYGGPHRLVEHDDPGTSSGSIQHLLYGFPGIHGNTSSHHKAWLLPRSQNATSREAEPCGGEMSK